MRTITKEQRATEVGTRLQVSHDQALTAACLGANEDFEWGVLTKDEQQQLDVALKTLETISDRLLGREEN